MILDICALLWLARGGGQLSAATRERLNAESAVYVSAISGFEIGIKYHRGKLELPARPADWFAAVLAHHDIQVLPLELDICIRATELPAIHADLCDRLIIATAEYHRMPVATADPIFQQYGITVLS